MTTTTPSIPRLSIDPAQWLALATNTPQVGTLTPMDALRLCPGTAVKAKLKHEKTYTEFGIVNRNTALLTEAEIEANPDCIVIGHGWNNSFHEKFVWRGNQQDFRRSWQID